MKRTTFHLTPDQIARLGAISGKTGLSVAELIRRAVDGYLGGSTTEDEVERWQRISLLANGVRPADVPLADRTDVVVLLAATGRTIVPREWKQGRSDGEGK